MDKAGLESIVVSGAVVSIVHVREADELVFPAASVALTWKVRDPSESPV